MPTYEYACGDCGHHLEVYQSFTDEPLTTCPSCGSSLRKVFGAVGIVLKGSGFYRNDSRSAAGTRSTKRAERPSSEGGQGTGGEGTSSDSSSASSSTAPAATPPSTSPPAAPSSGAPASAPA